MNRASWGCLGMLLLWGGTARAEETEKHTFGMGYKIGNGLGFMGADVVVRAAPHLTFDLQGSYFSQKVDTRTATGYGFAPTVQAELQSLGHTPYVGLGLLYAKLTLDSVSASGSGFVVNLGYQWRFASGIGVLVGGGLGYLGEIKATDGVTTVTRPGGFNPNIEAGVRYYF